MRWGEKWINNDIYRLFYTSFRHLFYSEPTPRVLVTVLVTVLVLTTALLTVLVTVVLAGPLVMKQEQADEISPGPRPSEMWMPPGIPSEISS